MSSIEQLSGSFSSKDRASCLAVMSLTYHCPRRIVSQEPQDKKNGRELCRGVIAGVGEGIDQTAMGVRR